MRWRLREIAPRVRRHVSIIGGKRMLLLSVVLTVSFTGSCIGLLGPAARLAEPVTRVPLDGSFQEPFPVLVVEGEKASVSMMQDPHRIPRPPNGASHLVPVGKERALERYVNEHERAKHDSGWVLNVKRLAPDRQRIELYLMGDGYWGGAYDATPETVTPQYRKITGPGFAFIVGAYSLVMNVILWGSAVLVVWLFARRNRVAQQAFAAGGGSHDD
jgi:hypothetical protein